MIKLMVETNPSINLTTPAQTLKQFTNWVKDLSRQVDQMKEQKRSQKQAMKSLYLQIKILEEQCINKESQIQLQKQTKQKLKQQNKSLLARREEEHSSLLKSNQQLSMELIELKEQNRLQKLMLIETKRREIQQIRQYHLKQFLQFRQKSDREVVFLEKQMQTQLNQKDKMLKDLEKALEKLSLNAKLEQNQSDSLIKLFKSFQEYNHLSKIIQERSQEIYKFRQQVQELEYSRIKLDSKLKEASISQANLQSHIQRLVYEKHDLESKLKSKNDSLVKSEQDKEALEEFYSKRWNKEFQNVKSQLEKGFLEKMKRIEEECSVKIEAMRKKVQESKLQHQNMQTRLEQAQNYAKQSQSVISRLIKEGEHLQLQIKRISRQKTEVQLMTGQEISQINDYMTASKLSYQTQISNLNALISVEKEICDDLQSLHNKKLQQFHEANKISQQRILAQKQKQKKILEHNFQKQIFKIQAELQQKISFIEQVRDNLTKQIQADYKTRWQSTRKQSQLRVKQRQEQLSKKNDRWMIKYKEVDAKYIALKKKQEEEQENLKKDISKLEIQNKNLKVNENKFHNETKEYMTIRAEFLMRVSDLQKRIIHLNEQIRKNSQIRFSLQSIIEEKSEQISTLIQSRKAWLTQLGDLQKSYRAQFDNLKKVSTRQSNIFKSKVWQLQEMIKKRPIKRKDYEKMQQLEKERKNLKKEIYIKQAQNIILNQVKGYYQSKFQNEEEKGKEQETARAGNALMGFKWKMLKKSSHKQAFTQSQQSKQMVEMRKYIVKSSKKSQNISLSKMKFQDLNRYHRFNTTHE